MKPGAKIQPWLTLIGRILLGAVLILAGYLKVKSPAEAQMAVRAYKLLPVTIANLFGLALPWLEMGAGLLLVVGLAVRYAAIFGGLLMLLFVGAISQAWARGLSIDCGCFGGGGQVAAGHTKYLQEILRDLGLTLTAIYLYRFPQGKFGIDKEDKEDKEIELEPKNDGDHSE
jgi:uncharacterized membrane protein YphA (DoxX/SURF4 family)